jgi:hypothetical protein
MGVMFYKYFFTMSLLMFYLLFPLTIVGEMYCYRIIKIQSEIWDFREDACED